MLINSVEISNHPVHGYTRKAECYRIDFEEPFGEQALIAYYAVKCFTPNDVELKEMMKRVSLKVDNTTPVNASGQYVMDSEGNYDWSNPDAVMGEYDFIIMAKNNGVDMAYLIEQGAVQADAVKKRFD